MTAEPLTPRSLSTPRSAGVAGVLFAVLFATTVFLIHRVVPADPHDSGAWLTNPSSRREVQIALWIVPFTGIFFMWFMGAVRSRVGLAEDRFFSTVFLGSGFLFIAMLFISSALMGALISLASHNRGLPPLSVWGLGRSATYSLTTTFALRMAAVFMIAASTIALRLAIHHKFIVWVGYASALVLLVAAPSLPYVELLFPLWVLLVSVSLLIQARRTDNGRLRDPGATGSWPDADTAE